MLQFFVRLPGVVAALTGLLGAAACLVDGGLRRLQLFFALLHLFLGALRSADDAVAAPHQVCLLGVPVAGAGQVGALGAGLGLLGGVGERLGGRVGGVTGLPGRCLCLSGLTLQLFDTVGGADGGQQSGLAAQRVGSGVSRVYASVCCGDLGHELVDGYGQVFKPLDTRLCGGLGFGGGVGVPAQLVVEDLDFVGCLVGLGAGAFADAFVLRGAEEFEEDLLPCAGVGGQEAGEVALGQHDALAEVVEGQAEQLLDSGVEFLDFSSQHFGLRPVCLDHSGGGVGELHQADGLLLDLLADAAHLAGDLVALRADVESERDRAPVARGGERVGDGVAASPPVGRAV